MRFLTGLGVLSLVLAVSGAAPPDALAHEVTHSIERSSAVVILLSHDDGEPFSNESYEVYRPNETVPFQTGRTDASGRIVFLPDRGGEWRVRAFAEDGHGTDFTFVTDAAMDVVTWQQSAIDHYGRIAAGVGIILGLFGLLSIFHRRRNPAHS
jgi:nickel transport protein